MLEVVRLGVPSRTGEVRQLVPMVTVHLSEEEQREFCAETSEIHVCSDVMGDLERKMLYQIWE